MEIEDIKREMGIRLSVIHNAAARAIEMLNQDTNKIDLYYEFKEMKQYIQSAEIDYEALRYERGKQNGKNTI